MSSESTRHSIEKKWQQEWLELQAFSPKGTGEKYYVLNMFPYPSGKLHVGHTRNYVIGDVIARYKRLLGYNVLNPAGWDAFGLPAENAAIEQGVMPWHWTQQNINSMKEELLLLGISYDWSREIATCDSNYYVHEQKLFLEMLQQGLAYKKCSLVNWDPVDQTVLANEQVVEGRGWRSGALIEKKEMNQWFFKITDFAEELLNDLNDAPGIPEKVKLMQRSWIGRAEGAVIKFAIEGSNEEVQVFSTRPETIFGCSFIAISCDHPLAIKCSINNPKMQEFITTCKNSDDLQEKFGFFTDLFALHPFDSSIRIPVFIANFVLMEYAFGAVFGCPAHDERDYEFALKYSLPILEVVKPNSENEKLPYTAASGVMFNSRFLNDLTTEQAVKEVIKCLKEANKGEAKVTYRLRDWGISRQRFWGCPIPIIYCKACGIVPVPMEQLPIELPKDAKFEGKGNPLDTHPTWKHVNCPKCGAKAQRETDTFDTFFESSWYFFRYVSPQSATLVDPMECAHWMPVDLYIGGIEHAILHYLYARFITKVLTKLGYCSIKEPFLKLLNQGMVLHHLFKDEGGKYVYPQDVQRVGRDYFHKETGEHVTCSAKLEKMSKSKKNLVSLRGTLEKYGADTVRLAVISDTPPERDLEWNSDGVEGCSRFLDKLLSSAEAVKRLESKQKNAQKSELTALLNQTIRSASKNLEEYKLNKAIALLRELYNGVQDAIKSEDPCAVTAFKQLILMLNPFIPHITEEIWQQLGEKSPIVQNKWPTADIATLFKEYVSIAVQINGKFKGTIQIKSSESQEEVLAKVREKFLSTNKKIKQVFFVQDKVINLVIDSASN
jgi:leucyl-tRNA synthetase